MTRPWARVSLVRVEVMVPYTEGGLLGEMRRAGVVVVSFR
jgi:hypothetical protein